MNKIILIASLFFIVGFTLPGEEGKDLLKKTIRYHDPNHNWANLKAKLYLTNTNSEGKVNDFELEFDNKTGYFCYINRQDGKEIVKGLLNDKEFFKVDGKKEFSEEDRKKYKLTSESIKSTRNFYGFLYGLPMKLTDAGAIVTKDIANDEVNGKSFPTIRVSYDPGVGKDNWFFYCDPATAALKAYRFNHGKPETGEYILLEEEINVNGVKMPKIRKWYLNKDDKYLGTDNLIKAERLRAYRN